MTIPEKPKSNLHKYRLTAKGEELKKKHIKEILDEIHRSKKRLADRLVVGLADKK